MREWFDDDSFWQEMYPYLFTPERFEAAGEEVDKVLSLTGVSGGAALDLCCGPGRHTLALAGKGFSVTGVDRTRFYLHKAMDRANEAGLEAEFVLSDMRDFVREDSYDLAVSMFTSFGYFDRKEDDLVVLKNIHLSLKTGGACLIDVVGKEWLARVFQPSSCDKMDDIKDGRARSFKLHHTLYSGQELLDRLELAGFGKTRLFGSLDGGEYDRDASRLVAVAWK